MKKLKIPNELAFFIGIILLAIGINLIIKADFGISVVQSSAFIVSQAFPILSFGTYSYLIQIVFVIILCIIIRKFSLRYVFSFASAVLYGYTIDLVSYLLTNMIAPTLTVRILFFLIGFFSVAIGVAMFFRTNIPLMPYDIFVTDLAKHKKWNINTVKIIYDFCCLVSGILLSLIFFKKLVGIGIGTVFTGLFSGICIKYVGKLIDKVIVFEPLIKNKNH